MLRIASELTVNQLLSLFGVVGILVLVSYAMLIGSGGATQGLQFARAFTIALLFSIAVACVVIPRQRWRIARRTPGGHRPVLFYILSGSMAVVITQAVTLAFSCLLERDFVAGWQRYLLAYPWLVVTFVTAVLTAFLVDNPPNPRMSKAKWRVIEGLIAAVVLVAAAIITHTWLVERVTIMGQDLASRLEFYVPPLGVIIAPTALIGFSIGYLVPAWFREVPSSSAALSSTVAGGGASTIASASV